MNAELYPACRRAAPRHRARADPAVVVPSARSPRIRAAEARGAADAPCHTRRPRGGAAQTCQGRLPAGNGQTRLDVGWRASGAHGYALDYETPSKGTFVAPRRFRLCPVAPCNRSCACSRVGANPCSLRRVFRSSASMSDD